MVVRAESRRDGRGVDARCVHNSSARASFPRTATTEPKARRRRPRPASLSCALLARGSGCVAHCSSGCTVLAGLGLSVRPGQELGSNWYSLRCHSAVLRARHCFSRVASESSRTRVSTRFSLFWMRGNLKHPRA